MDHEEKITPIGVTNYRNSNQKFGIKDGDRGHVYVLGKTGMGKSTLLLNMAISDIERGNGICIIDPHSELCSEILNHIQKHRLSDVIYFNATDLAYPIAFNPIKGIHPNFHHLVASGLVAAFKKLWYASWGPRLEYILRLSLLTLLAVPDATLLDIQPLLTNKDYRERALSYITDATILAFWHDEFDKYSSALRAEATAPILNKTGLFLTSIPLRNIVGQKTRSFRLQQVLDEGKILIVNLSKGEIGEDASSLLGSLLITSIQLAALHRAAMPEEKRRPFYLYIDEMHSFLSLSITDILAEARKYKLSLFLTHQYLDQLDEKIRAAIFGNVGTLITFRVGAPDAAVLAKEMYPIFTMDDLIKLPRYAMYLKLMIDGSTSSPFSANALPKRQRKEEGMCSRTEVIANSRKLYCHSRKEVEESIVIRYPVVINNDLIQGSLL